MNYQDLLQQLTPELYATFRRSLELGRWPDGREMTPEQREHCMAAVIAYDALHRDDEDRVGYIDKSGKKKQAGDAAAETLRWKSGNQED